MKAAVLSIAIALGAGGAAHAADKHGGHEVEVGKYHVEQFVKDRDITVHVRDQGDKPIDAKTVKASANVLRRQRQGNRSARLGGRRPEGPGTVSRSQRRQSRRHLRCRRRQERASPVLHGREAGAQGPQALRAAA